MLTVNNYSQLPLSFELNQGQADNQADYLCRGKGYSVILSDANAVLKLGLTSMLKLQLINANEAPKVSGETELPGKANYFIGNDPSRWHINIPTYGKVRYQEVYPGVDMVYYGKQGQLEWDFVLAPGADYSSISMAVAGCDQLQLNDLGDLVITLGKEKIYIRKPFAYQTINNRQQQVSAEYELVKDQVRFKLGEYDRERELVIDPVLVYSTYLGGLGTDQGNSIAVDADGNAYVTGFTTSTDTSPPGFPTANPIQPNNNGDYDVFVTKINAVGNALVYSTYLGGGGTDQGLDIAVDADGNAYVTGFTNSSGTTSPPGFPTVNPIQPDNNDENDAFVLKISSRPARGIKLL